MNCFYRDMYSVTKNNQYYVNYVYFREESIDSLHLFCEGRVCNQFSRRKMSSSRDSGEQISSQSGEVLEEVNEYVKKVFALLDRETNRVRKEKDALDEAAKKLEHVHFSKMVKLNVGGNRFETSLATLNKDPGIFELLLHAVAVTRGMLNF